VLPPSNKEREDCRWGTGCTLVVKWWVTGLPGVEKNCLCLDSTQVPLLHHGLGKAAAIHTYPSTMRNIHTRTCKNMCKLWNIHCLN